MPKVSFILPAYKRRFLKEALDSILAQTCRDFELVIVDDKSPESLYEVIREYSWEPSGKMISDQGREWFVDGVDVRYYQNEANLGGKDLVAAWNLSMKYATGEWCVLASDDDEYLPQYVEEMLRLAAKYPECDLFHCRLAVIDAEGKWKRVGPQWSEFTGQIPFVYAKAVSRLETFAPDFMFRRSALEALGGFIEFPLAIYSDDATWMKLARHGVGCSSAILFKWRASGQNICTRTDNALGKLSACEKFRSWFSAFASALTPVTDEDATLLTGILQATDKRVDRLARIVMGSVVRFSAWVRALRSSPQRNSLKREFVYDRFPRLKALRMLLPHFSQWRRK